MSGKNKNKKNDKPKRGGFGIFFLPKPQGQKHKHKKNKYYVSNIQSSPMFTRSIMSSGDSPTHNRTAEAFDFNSPSNQSENRPHPLESKPLPLESKPLPLDGRSSPVATTSRDIGVQSGRGEEKAGDKGGRGEIQASVLVEPGGEKEKEEEGKGFGSPTLNNVQGGGDQDKEGERKGKGDNGGFDGKDKKDRKDDKFRKNGNIDKLDGVWVPKDQKKPQEDQEDDDNCIVKCLYVTMTCCECSIM